MDIFQQLLALHRRRRDDIGIVFALDELARTAARDDPRRARALYEEALAVARRGGAGRVWRSLEGLARLDRREGNLDRAQAGYREAVERLEGFRDHRPGLRRRGDLMRRNQDLYHEWIDLLVQRHLSRPGGGDDVTVFHVSERSRARALLERIMTAHLDRSRALWPELTRRESMLKERIAGLQEQLQQVPPDSADSSRIQDALTSAEVELDELDVALRRGEPQSAPVSKPGAVGLEEAQALLDPATAIISYVLTSERTLAMVVTTRGFHLEVLPAAPRIFQAQVPNYLELLRRGAGWEAVARRLHGELMAPLLAHLGDGIRHLIIVPDGPLHALLFDTLLGAGADGRERPLLEDVGVSYAPSVTILAELMREDPPAGIASILLFADPALSDETPKDVARMRYLYADQGLHLSLVPGSRREARFVSRYAGPGGRILQGPQASEERLKGLRLRGFTLLHFATHGLLSETDPMGSALVLAPGGDHFQDGFLQAREIARLDLDADLVVLSACRSARGALLPGEGVQGLAQAFLHAGARSVIGTLWNVDDRETAAFVEEFYYRLAAGDGKAEALRNAKLARRAALPAAGPLHWAAFVLLGEPFRRLPLAAAPVAGWGWRWALAGAVAALAAVVGASRRRGIRRTVGLRRAASPRRSPGD
ncbi:MAG: CHAT domain-containing protein [Acidobacteriota bacterium]